MHANSTVSMMASLMLFILITNNLSIVNSIRGTTLTISNISRIILYADPIFGGLKSLYTIKKAIYVKNKAVKMDIKVGFRIR